MNSDKQCVNSDFCPCTVNQCEITVHAQEKKKNLKKRGRRIQLNPNAHKNQNEL